MARPTPPSAFPTSTRPAVRSIAELLARRWSLTLGPVWDHADATCSWVSPATRADGERVVLKIGVPHFEAEHEIAGLRFWQGDPTVRLLDADESLNALLLEACIPGTSLRMLPGAEQDRVVAELLPRLWRAPEHGHPFRHLSAMIDYWCRETRAGREHWTDAELVEEGIRVFQQLAQPADGDVLLATDLHAGNVLRAERTPWLVIDPKPFVGDPAYDATQHLFNRGITLHDEPRVLIRELTQHLSLDSERVSLWLFARAAAEPRASWTEDTFTLARKLRP